MARAVIGRDGELAAVERFVSDSATRPSALVVAGVAGIGKTTLWRATCRAARAAGRRVLTARGAAAEVRLAYTGLADLLADVDSLALAGLPTPQRAGLEAALLRGDEGGGEPPDPRVVATGLTSLLDRLAAEAPVVVAVDDLQWLDASTADALRFAARRVSGPVGIVVAVRRRAAGAADAELQLRDDDHPTALWISPLAAADLARVVTDRVDTELAHRALARIVELSGGNPFAALELARAMIDEPLTPATPLPESLRELVEARLSVLEPDAREAILYAAMLTRPDVPRIQRALGERDAEALLGAAEREGIITLEGARVAFAHPLLATGAYAAQPPPRRRAAHRAMAAVTDDPEEHARHLALGAVDAEPRVVDALDTAARVARSRGSAAGAAELLELAIGLGADAVDRRVRAASHHLDAGDVARARELLSGVVDELGHGTARSAALGQLGSIHRLADDFVGSLEFFEQAITECREPALRIALSLELAFARTQSGLVLEAVPIAESALADAHDLGHRGLLAQALAVRAMVRFLTGHGADEPALERALELEDFDRPTPVMLRPSLMVGLVWQWIGRHEEAHVAVERARNHARERGEESDLVNASMHAGTLACLRGDVAHGQAMVEDSLRRARALASPTSRIVALENQIVVAGWTGDVETSRAAAAEAFALTESARSPVNGMFARAGIGRVELSLGRAAAAADLLLPAANIAVAMGAGDPGPLYWAADAIEALTVAGRTAEAEPIQRWLRERSDAIGRQNILAIAARSDAIVHAATGRLPEAERALDDAVLRDRWRPDSFELARTELVLGQVRRRRRRRAAARRPLEDAAARFTALGAVLWAQRARDELARLDGVHAAGVELTAAEERVAVLAAAGSTNRAAAAELFVSPKTIEATLSRVYRKLGIRTRAELGRWMAEREPAALERDG